MGPEPSAGRRPGGTLLIAGATAAALVAFASNSILCRLALGSRAVDPVTFTVVRLASGATALLAVAGLTGRAGGRGAGNWVSGALLFLYAICFSLAYVVLRVGTGALILFGAVQLTMLLAAVASGERPQPLQWTGLLLALGGFVYLVSPGLAAPSPAGSVLMTAAGVAWGFYTLRGRGAADPITDTTDNFVRAVPFVLAAGAASLPFGDIHVTARGLGLAVASGAVTSGLGYVVWYVALRGLTATRAAGVQLTVPVIAALAGILFMAEPATWRLGLSSVAILGGVSLVLAGREAAPRSGD